MLVIYSNQVILVRAVILFYFPRFFVFSKTVRIDNKHGTFELCVLHTSNNIVLNVDLIQLIVENTVLIAIRCLYGHVLVQESLVFTYIIIVTMANVRYSSHF